MASKMYDCVYYWVGGTERGKWNCTPCQPADVDAMVESITRQGYVALRGKQSIGAPEDGPTESEWKRLNDRIMWKRP